MRNEHSHPTQPTQPQKQHKHKYNKARSEISPIPISSLDLSVHSKTRQTQHSTVQYLLIKDGQTTLYLYVLPIFHANSVPQFKLKRKGTFFFSSFHDLVIFCLRSSPCMCLYQLSAYCFSFLLFLKYDSPRTRKYQKSSSKPCVATDIGQRRTSVQFIPASPASNHFISFFTSYHCHALESDSQPSLDVSVFDATWRLLPRKAQTNSSKSTKKTSISTSSFACTNTAQLSSLKQETQKATTPQALLFK